MPNHRLRLDRLEARQTNAEPADRIIQEIGETQAACLARHYPDGVPADRLIIIRVIV